MELEALYAQLKALAETVPNFNGALVSGLGTEDRVWLARLHALINTGKFGPEAVALKLASDGLGTALHGQNVNQILNTLFRAIAAVEMRLPRSEQGAFIPAGNAFDIVATVSKIMAPAQTCILVVDPYIGCSFMENYAVQAREGVRIEILGAMGKVKEGLLPAVRAWVKQYGDSRPITVRLAPSKKLHDRLIIVDSDAVWDVSQSFEHLAARSPATFSKAAPELARLKMEAYREMFETAENPL